MKPRRSLLRRLLLWQSGTIVITLSILTLALSLIVTSRLRQHHDEDLTRVCREVVSILTELDEQGEFDARERALANVAHEVEVRTLVSSDPPLRDGMKVGEVSLSNRAARRGGSGSPDGPHGHEALGSMRIASSLFRTNSGEPFLIEVSENLGDLDSTLSSLKQVILTVAPLVLLLSIGVGAVIIVRALRPLRSLVRWASSLEIERLGSQIEVEEGFEETLVLVDAFNQMTERLGASFRQVQEFAANASHELRTPLTSLTSSFEVALSKPREGDDYREVLRRSLPEVRRLSRIVENLLVMAQVDAGYVVLKTNQVELDAVLLESYEAMHMGGMATGITIELGDMDVGEIEGDSHWLRQMFDNLIGNAVKYSLANGVVRVSATSTADEVTVTIEDDGPGVPEDEREFIFHRYYRVESESGKVSGVGLGLSIAKWAAEAHGGDIRVEGVEPRGSRFMVTLPRSQPKRNEADTSSGAE